MGVTFNEIDMKVLPSADLLPAGFVCLGHLWPANPECGRDRERVKRGVVEDQVDAYRIAATESEVKSRRGPVYVHESQAKAWLESFSQRASREAEPIRKVSEKRLASADYMPQAEAAALALCEINNGITIACGLLERLTQAVEIIATQPKQEPVGSWRDMNGESL